MLSFCHSRILSSLLLATLSVLLFALPGFAGPFVDTFESDSSNLYSESDSFGTGGFFVINEAGQTLEIEAASGNTHLVMLDDGVTFLEVGEFLEVTSATGVGASSPHQYVVVSNTNRQPSPVEGFRFRRSPDLRIQGGDSPGSTTVLADPGDEGGITYRIERPTETGFRFFYDAGEGFVDLGTYELTDAQPAMHVGMQAWAGTSSFDRLVIGTLAGEENSAPTDLFLSRRSVRVGSPTGTVVGDFRAVDPNPGDEISFELLSVDGGVATNPFEVVDGELRTTASLDTPGSFQLEIRAVDSGGLALVKNIEVLVTDPLVVFGAVADVQYADKLGEGGRDYRGSLTRLQDAVSFFNTQSDLDFVISLGDFIDDQWESFDDVLPLWDQLQAPATYHVLGNHDFDEIGFDNVPEVAGRLGMPSRYYSFEPGGNDDRIRFIVLDGQEFATFTTRPGTPERLVADQLRARASQRGQNGYDWNGGVGPVQLTWLQDQLDAATRDGKNVVIFCHYPIFPLGAAHNTHSDHELKAVIEQYPVVKAWMNGHQHGGGYQFDQGVHFVTMKGMVEQAGANAYAVCALFADRLEINGIGNESDRRLEFASSFESSGAIDSLHLESDTGVVNIRWTDLDQDEAGYVIERRRLGSGQPYLRLANVGPDDTTFEDTTFPGSGDYRYRIAPLSPDAVGPWGAYEDVRVQVPGPRPFQIFEVERDAGSGEVSLKWPSEPGEEFTLERSPDLRDWTALADNIPAAASPETVTSFLDANPSEAATWYYRVSRNGPSGGGTFSDDFSSDTSADYTGSDSFGSGGSFSIATGAGTLDLQAAPGNTFLVMLDDGEHFLEAGEYVEVVTTSGVGGSAPHQFVVISNTVVQPTETEGFRFRRSPSLRIWGGDAPGAATTLADPDNEPGITYRIERLSATEFRFLYEGEAGTGFIDLGTYLLPDAAPLMYVGMQGWAGLTSFGRLTLGDL